MEDVSFTRGATKAALGLVPTIGSLPAAPPPVLVEHLLETAVGDVGLESDEEEFFDAERLLESGTAYSWEAGYDRSWDQPKEKEGRRGPQAGDVAAAGPEDKPPGPGRKGGIRNVVILLDMSEATREIDFRPDRFNYALAGLEEFFETFFQFNPIANVGIVAMLHGQAIVLSPLSGTPAEQMERLADLRARDIAGGSVSLLNGLERSLALLIATPPYGSREIIVVFSSINSCDAGNVDDVIAELKERGVRVSVVSLAPELYVLKRICTLTDGTYKVCRTKDDLKEALLAFREAPSWTPFIETRLVTMGFPQARMSSTVSLCICHNRPSLKGIFCPRCHCKVCEVPTKCKACQLPLVSAADIARTSQHLMPVAASKSVTGSGTYLCGLCARPFTNGGAECSQCGGIRCHDCNVFAIGILQQCPTCLRQQELRRVQALHEDNAAPDPSCPNPIPVPASTPMPSLPYSVQGASTTTL